MSEIRDLPALPSRAADAHKGSFGTVLVLAGSDGMFGAAVLTARGALRGGAGLVRCALPAAVMTPFTMATPAALTVDRGTTGPADLLAGVDAVVAGPGLGLAAAERALLAAVLAEVAVPTVLDADALNASAPLVTGSAPELSAVLTPHPGEAARLLDWSTAEVLADRRQAARELQRRSGGVVVLKGRGTLVTDGARWFENTTGNPGLATGGSGDVLAGLLGALLARGMRPFEAACLAVHVHGAAGDRLAAQWSESGLIAEDLPLAIAAELAVHEGRRRDDGGSDR